MPEDCDESFSSAETLAGIRAFGEEISARLGHGGKKDIIHSNMGFYLKSQDLIVAIRFWTNHDRFLGQDQ